MNRKKLTVRLEPGQACVVADISFWHHIIDVYKAMAADTDDKEDRLNWLIVAEQINDWIDKTYVPFEDEQL